MTKIIRHVTPEAPVYGTKCCLTTGITTHTTGTVVESLGGRHYYRDDLPYPTLVKMGSFAWEVREEAEADARAKAARKIESIKKQLRRLEPLVIAPEWDLTEVK